MPFGRPSSTLVAPENQRLLSPLAPTGLVVHLLRCKHKRGCKRVPPGEDDRPRQSRGGGDFSARRVPEEDRVHRVAQVPGGFLALPSTGPSREGFDHFLDLCFVPLQKAAHEPLRLGPRQRAATSRKKGSGSIPARLAAWCKKASETMMSR